MARFAPHAASTLRYTPAMRRHRLRGLGAAPLCALALVACGTPEAPAPPNLLLVSIDTLRADRLACYGGPPDAGRAICALADGGVRFAWAFAPAPYTAPSVASILTSLYPAFHGVSQNATSFLRNEAVSVAEELRAAGYTTAAFVSNPVLDRTRNLAQGFAVWDQRMNRRERNRPGFSERDARAATDAALAWAQVAIEPPWFVWVHYQDPHGPYEPPDAPPPRDPPGEARLPVLPEHSGVGGIPGYQALPGLFTKSGYEHAYLDEVRFVDTEVKRLVEGLDALGEPPAVLLTSDHGEAFGEDGVYFAHGHSVGLDQIRVPLLWRPRRPGTARVVETPVSLIDVAPTLLAAAGLAPPPDFQGTPLPIEGAADEPGTRAIFAEHGRNTAVVVGRDYYARDRRAFAAAGRDRISGGRVLELPPRTARLAGDGPLPPYAPAGDDGPAAALDPLLSAYLESASQPGAARRRAKVPERLREQLRALGYLE